QASALAISKLRRMCPRPMVSCEYIAIRHLRGYTAPPSNESPKVVHRRESGNRWLVLWPLASSARLTATAAASPPRSKGCGDEDGLLRALDLPRAASF